MYNKFARIKDSDIRSDIKIFQLLIYLIRFFFAPIFIIFFSSSNIYIEILYHEEGREGDDKGRNDQINWILSLAHSRRLINYAAPSISYRCCVFILTAGRGRKQNAIYLIGSFDPANATIELQAFFFSRRGNSGINFRGNNDELHFSLKMCQFAGVRCGKF